MGGGHYGPYYYFDTGKPNGVNTRKVNRALLLKSYSAAGTGWEVRPRLASPKRMPSPFLPGYRASLRISEATLANASPSCDGVGAYT